MTGRIEVHAHLIPGVDDGCRTVEDSIQSARRLVQAGYTHCFCTPHIHASFPANTLENIRHWTANLQATLESAGIPLGLLPGGEINAGENMINTPPDELITCGLRGRYVLIDSWAKEMPDHFRPLFEWLKSLGLTPILAHPERMGMIQAKPELADVLADWGVLLQGNLLCLTEPPDKPTRQISERFLREGRYELLATDLHRPDSIDARLSGLAAAAEMVGEETVDRLTITNPAMLMAD